MTQLAGILGYPLSHTISPIFQQAAFDHYSLPVRYEVWSTPPDALKTEVEKLRGDLYLGGNVTVPHKVTVQELLDEIDPQARSIGAVNTIVKQDGHLVGFNTDSYGFVRSLKEVGGFNPTGKKVVLLGAGGAARAAVFGLAQERTDSLVIANRTLERAEALADEARMAGTRATAIRNVADELESACADADLIVNSTSVGMSRGDADGSSPLPASMIPSGALVFDMVYNPSETPLLVEAVKAGAKSVGGLPMLIYQGAAAFERWTGKEAPVEVMYQAGEKALSQPASAV